MRGHALDQKAQGIADNDIIDIFGTYGKKKKAKTGDGINDSSSGEEEELNEDELKILSEFEKNDKELEEIAG